MFLISSRDRKKLFITFLIVELLLLFFAVQKTSAISNVLPDPNDMSAGNDVFVVVSRINSNGSNSLFAPQARINAYVSNPNSNLIIEHAGSCAGQPDAANVPTNYKVFRGTNTEGVGGQFYDQNINTCTNVVIWLGDKGLVQSTIAGHAGYYMVAIDVLHLGPDGGGGVNAFKVRVDDPAGIVGYTSRSDAKFAMQDRFGAQDPNSTSNMDMYFAPDCSLLPGQSQNVDLRWFDDDWGSNAQLSNSSFTTRVYEYRVSDGALTDNYEVQPRGGNQPAGGPDQVRTITVKGGHRYRWTWFGVSKTNGIQFRLPFDSFNYSTAVNCVPPVNNATVSVHAFAVDDVGNYLADVPSVVVATCNATANNTQVSDSPSTGFTRFTVKKGEGFCIVITSTGFSPGSDQIPGYDGPFIRPWAEGYESPASPICRLNNFPNPPTGYDFSNLQNHCNDKRYDYQIAGLGVGFQDTDGNGFLDHYDRSDDGGYDFVYVKQGPPPPPLFCSPSFSSAEVGLDTSFSASGGAGFYTWSATSSSPSSGVGAIFTTKFLTPGPQTVTVNSGAQSDNCSVNVELPSTNPYFRVYGGDISAGGGFKDSCSFNNKAGILAFNNPVNGAGAGVELAAFAYSSIFGVSSAAMRTTAGPPNPIKGLTFSSTAGDPIYGGDFNSAACASNYFDLLSGVDPAIKVDIGSTYAGNPSFSGKQVYYHDGDVTITNNVIYSGTGGWASISAIPSHYLVVRGNIYIKGNVTQLDGVYIAQPDSSGNRGVIYTCADDGGRYSSPAILSNCGSSLTVNGAFVAKTIKLLRIKGDLVNATVDEPRTSNNLAEIFNYTPELFIAPSPFTSASPFQSVTGLPPVL